jgi:GNAT superfamily N-acetyltransferase
MHCTICGADACYVCGRSGRPVCPEHARIEVVSRLSFGSSDGLSIREALPTDYEQIGGLARYFKGMTKIPRLGREYDVLQLPAFVIESSDQISGVLSYAIEPESLLVVLLDVLPGHQGLGGGRMLVEAARTRAAAEGKTAILASATNDDLPAIYFYQKSGFRIHEVKPCMNADLGGAVKAGFAGIPCRDEVHFRLDV